MEFLRWQHAGRRVSFDPAEVAAVEECDDQTVVILRAGEHLQITATYEEVMEAIWRIP